MAIVYTRDKGVMRKMDNTKALHLSETSVENGTAEQRAEQRVSDKD